MPGIFGLANNESIEKNLNQMSSQMLLYSHYIQERLFIDESIGGSRIHLGKICNKQIETENYVIWVEGEAYNIEDISTDFNCSKTTTLSEILLIANERDQLDKCLSKLDGYFCAAIYDIKRKKIKLISDRYGMRVLYWYHKDGLFAWGSEVKALLAVDEVDKKLNTTSFNCFMELGYLLGENTWFKHIKLIRPSTIIEYDMLSNSITEHHYWRWSEVTSSSLTFDEAVDELGRIFINSVSRRFDPNKRMGISLSGGLDSRAILAAVDYLYPNYRGYSFTFGTPGCSDIRIAEQVINRTNWKHKIYHFGSDNWFKPRFERIWNTDGMLDMMHMHGSEFLDDVSECVDINLNGYCGDAILGGSFLSRIPYNERINDLNSDLFYREFSSLADINNCFYDINHVEPNLYMNRVRRFTNYGTVNSLSWLEQRKPFFDNQLVEFIFSLPDEFRADNRLYSTMLQKYFPKFFKDIPWQTTGKPAGLLKKNGFSFRLQRKIKIILDKFFGLEFMLDYTDYPSWIRDPVISSELKKLLEPEDAYYRIITNEDLSKRWLIPHLNSPAVNNSNQILRAATLEIYLRKVFKK